MPIGKQAKYWQNSTLFTLSTYYSLIDSWVDNSQFYLNRSNMKVQAETSKGPETWGVLTLEIEHVNSRTHYITTLCDPDLRDDL